MAGTGAAPSPRQSASCDTGVERFKPRCLSLDLEVGVRDRRIRAFAALRPDTGERLVFRGGNLEKALAELDALADGAAFLLGHNLILFDLPHLAAVQPDLRLLHRPAVDTLWLNPLAFPRNPYHHLVKHYQDGRLKRGRLNDPELDARLALDLFRDQRHALARVAQKAPDLIAAWHWLTTGEEDTSGFNTFFASLRGALRPSGAQAHEAIRRRLTGIVCRTRERVTLAGFGFGVDRAGSGIAGPDSREQVHSGSGESQHGRRRPG